MGDLTRLHVALRVRAQQQVEDFGLVQFHTLDVNEVDSLTRVADVVDKANGYVLGPDERREPEFVTKGDDDDDR
jgi:hypothetical protein